MRPWSERGVALLTVLLLVAMIATLAAGVLDDIRFGLRRSANVQSVGQARWYALGAETLAAAQLRRLAALDPARTSLVGGWNGRPFRFAVDGGEMQGRVSDGSACFNLNSVVEGAPGQYRRSDLGLAQFKALMAALGLGQREADLTGAALVDWIDTDDLREEGGAEDETYARAPKPYRTAATLLAEVSELRAVRGFTPDLYRRLRPYVCALPTAELSPINVNTLPAERAVLLTMLTDGQLPTAAARRLIERRPAAGWPDTAAFWREGALVDVIPGDPVVNQVAVRSRFFNLETEVAFGDSEVFASALLEQDRAGVVRVAARRWGREE